jgi:hypothetical protein
MKNEQTDDQEPNADQDLDAAFLGLEANLAGASKQQHQREGDQAIHEPVRLGLGERDHDGDGADRREDPGRRIQQRHRDRGGNPERRPDRLSPDPVSFSGDDVEHQDENGLGDPVWLGPSQGHTDRRGATQDQAEHDGHPSGDEQDEMVAVDDLGGAEPARDDDAIQRRDGHDDAVDHGVGRRGHRGHKGGGIGDHQQRREPPKPDPGAGKDARGGQQRRPPPVIGGERS